MNRVNIWLSRILRRDALSSPPNFSWEIGRPRDNRQRRPAEPADEMT